MGSIEIDGEDITTFDQDPTVLFRRSKIAMVFQHFGLLSHRTVINNVAFGLEVQHIDEDERKSKSNGSH